MAGTQVSFAREQPEDARLLLTAQRDDLLDADPDDEFRARLDGINAPLTTALTRLTKMLRRRADARGADAVTRAVLDLPNATIRRHMRDGGQLPGWLERDVETAARRLLQS